MKFFSSKRRMAAAAVIMLALFLIRPGASQLKSRIIRSISAGVGRPVDIGAVHIRLLPRPGFDLDNLVVYDDPAFGAEPLLRASQVTADLRLTSLVRGRMEIARLDLTEPSLNLVHQVGGRWNVEALLERTAHIPLAPTAKTKSEPRPGFPYIESSSGRINFKFGAEKTPFALTNADFSLWQDSENAWGVRLRAQPFRSDLNLNDTGQLQINGTWQRAESLRDTPLQFSLEWSRAQLGQVTKFFTGNDKGWRGTVQLDIALAGTPASLRMTGDGSLDDFRRYDITSGKALRLAGHCDAEYSSVNHEFHQVMCNAPVGSGIVTFTGDMGLPGSHRYAISMTAENIPASAVVTAAQRSKKDLPDDLVAQGTIHANFSMREDAASGSKRQFGGQGEFANFHLSSVANKTDVGPETIPFSFSDSPANASRPALGRNGQGLRIPEGPHVEIGPFPVATGRTGTLIARGWINRGGYYFTVTGETEVARALRLARTIGLPSTAAMADGTAQVDLQTAASWARQNGPNGSGFAGLQITGTARLRSVHITVQGTGSPISIASAEVQLLPDKVRVARLSATAAGSDWTGWIEMPRGCATANTCPSHFSLSGNEVDLTDIREWLSPNPAKKAWYQVLDSDSKRTSLWTNLNASGHVTADHLQIQDATATHVAAQINLAKATLEISDLEADFLGGKYRGTWQTDFSAKPAICSGSGTLNGISLTSLADVMKDPWVTGKATTAYNIKGACPADFWQSAEGTLRVDMTDGLFSHLVIGDSTDPFRVTRLRAQAQLRAGKIEITDANLDSPEGKFQLKGTVSLKPDLDLKLERNQNGAGATGYAITGTLAEPHVAPMPGTEQARLKPLPSK